MSFYVQESYEALPVEQKVSFILLKHFNYNLLLLSKQATILFVEVKHAWMSILIFLEVLCGLSG